MQASVRLKMSNEVGSPGLVVKGGDSRYEGRGVKSRHHILDGHDIFSPWFVVKIVLFAYRIYRILGEGALV